MMDTKLPGSLSVLVVDDCVDTTTSLTILGQVWGHRVFVANDGRTALQLAVEQLFDAVILDLGMPDMTGWELARRLRQLPGYRGALLVALTGYGHEEARRRSVEAGCDLHLLKPIDPEEIRLLLAALEKDKRVHVP
jgi:CheY-like chemotaxis protein